MTRHDYVLDKREHQQRQHDHNSTAAAHPHTGRRSPARRQETIETVVKQITISTCCIPFPAIYFFYKSKTCKNKKTKVFFECLAHGFAPRFEVIICTVLGI